VKAAGSALSVAAGQETDDITVLLDIMENITHFVSGTESQSSILLTN
jgi:hypothetical protein